MASAAHSDYTLRTICHTRDHINACGKLKISILLFSPDLKVVCLLREFVHFSSRITKASICMPSLSIKVSSDGVSINSKRLMSRSTTPISGSLDVVIVGGA